LKKNINEIKYGLDEVMKLQAVTYNWKDNDDKRLQLGFIAQDVEKVVPEIVTKSGISDEEFERLEKKGEKVTDTYGMQYTGLIPVLVKAIQEQQKVIEDNASRISQLENKLQKMNDLEARLNLIEALMNSQKSETRTSINDK
jgi:flagellar biosynthesis chaperone FliJ